MSRPIDAEELLQILDKQKTFEMLDHKRNNAYGKGMRDAMKIIEKAPTIGGWVSVKDRLPNDGQDVLAYLYNGEETRTAPFNYDKGTWYDCVMNCTVAINSITHWMPLPEPPKEVSE